MPSSPTGALGERETTFRRWLSPLLGIPTPVIFIAGAVVATVLLWRGDALDNVGSSLRGASPVAGLAILLVYAGSITILGARWHALTRMAGGAPPWAASIEVFLTSVIVNYAAPIGLAVPTRAALSMRDLGLTAGQSAAVVAWEAALDVAALLVISVVWVAMGGFTALQTITVDQRALLIVAVAAVGMALAVGALARAPRFRSQLAPALRRFLALPRRSPGLALAAMASTALFWAMQMGVMAGLLHLFGAGATTSLVFGIMGLPVLIGMLSPVPGGAGIREALMAGAAQLDGVPAGPVILAAVAYRLALFIVTPAIWTAVRLVRHQAT